MDMLRITTSRTAQLRIFEVKYGAVEDVCSALKKEVRVIIP
jgi:hypothetical protein